MNISKNQKISITIPAYNEEKNINYVCRNVIDNISRLTSNFEILFVNDGSEDNTGRIIENFKEKYKNKIRVIHHKKNKGFTGAMRSCYENAEGNLIFLGPADGQFDYSQIKLFIKELIKNKQDIVVAYRAINEETFLRKFNSFFFHLISKILFGIYLKEFSSCMLYTKEVRDHVKVEADQFSALFLPEFIYKSMKKGFKFGQVPIHFYKRKSGEQKGIRIKMIVKTLSEMFRFWLQIKTGKVQS